MNSQWYMYMFRKERSDLSVHLIGQTNRHLYKIAHYKNIASNLLDYIEKEALRCNKREQFLHGRFWSRSRQRDVLTNGISFERVKNYFERLTVNG